MIWLLIIFCLAVALSPLMWMKATPHQQLVTATRAKARSLSINVNICRQPDAIDSETRLDAILYWLPWQKDTVNQVWVLQRRTRRGWESSFDGWRWVNNQAHPSWQQIIELIIQDLPAGISAIVANKEGIGMVWDERADEYFIDDLHQNLINLRKKGEEICT
jgi:hypothetical protein